MKLPVDPCDDREHGPGDGFLATQIRALASQVNERKAAQHDDRPIREIYRAESERLLPDEFDLALKFEPSIRQICYGRQIAKRFFAMKADLASRDRDAISETEATTFVKIKVQVEFGAALNYQTVRTLRRIIHDEPSGPKREYVNQRINQALSSFGSATTRAGTLYAVPVRLITRLLIDTALALVCAFGAFCLITLATQLLTPHCQGCVVLGAFICAWLTYIFGLILWEAGEKRHRHATFLCAHNILPVACRRPGERLRFLG